MWTTAAALWLCWTQARPGLSFESQQQQAEKESNKGIFTNVANISFAQDNMIQCPFLI